LRLFVGDDWAEQHHDVELMDASGRRLAKARLPEGVAGMTKLHAMIAGQLGEAAQEAEVVIGIETDRGPWVQALVAAGYTVLAVNPLQASRYQERLSVSGAKSSAVAARVPSSSSSPHRPQLLGRSFEPSVITTPSSCRSMLMPNGVPWSRR
jgi:hypothetical protein